MKTEGLQDSSGKGRRNFFHSDPAPDDDGALARVQGLGMLPGLGDKRSCRNSPVQRNKLIM